MFKIWASDGAGVVVVAVAASRDDGVVVYEHRAQTHIDVEVVLLSANCAND